MVNVFEGLVGALTQVLSTVIGINMAKTLGPNHVLDSWGELRRPQARFVP